MWVSSCVLRLLAKRKVFWQVMHLKSLTPLWVSSCSFRLLARANVFWQVMHLKSFTPVCTITNYWHNWRQCSSVKYKSGQLLYPDSLSGNYYLAFYIVAIYDRMDSFNKETMVIERFRDYLYNGIYLNEKVRVAYGGLWRAWEPAGLC